MPERRAAEDTRKRVDEIAASMESYRERLDRRYTRFGQLIVTLVAIGILAVVAGYGILQGQRWEQSRDGCLRTNQQTDATVGLLRDLGVRDRVILIAEARYPHVPPLAHRNGKTIVPGPPSDYDGPMSCDEFASARVGWFRL